MILKHRGDRVAKHSLNALEERIDVGMSSKLRTPGRRMPQIKPANFRKSDAVFIA
jgi:hypothetical protein